MKKLNFILIILLISAIIFVLRLPKKEKKYISLEREIPVIQNTREEPTPILSPSTSSEPTKPEEKVEMRVNFYALDPEKATKGEFLGTAELRGGKLVINVTDPKLKEILEKPYSTLGGEVKEEVAIDYAVTYQPGTVEHLRAIAIECWQFSYIGEIVE
ncbi:MAG: hypothetical protein NC818_02325 [Candidatus Omnitrophica bacterium]|nr:hypothetical protein [Candidatus Omnitrophota bacterium]